MLGRTYCVIDIETAPDPVAVSLAGAKGATVAGPLHRLTALSLLVATENADGSWAVPKLTTFGSPLTEFDILLALDAALAALSEQSPVLVSFNGIGHDLDVIVRRAAVHLMFALPGLNAIADLEHDDLMRTMTRGWRDRRGGLRQACAGFGIPTDHEFSMPRGATIDRQARKSQVDVLATLILLLHEVSIRRRNPDALVNGWTAVESMLDAMPHRLPHLEQFRPSVRVKAFRDARDGGQP